MNRWGMKHRGWWDYFLLGVAMVIMVLMVLGGVGCAEGEWFGCGTRDVLVFYLS